MSLTLVTQPAFQNAVYNPITYLFSSDVRDDYTIGAQLSVGAGNITNTAGYVTFFSAAHGLLHLLGWDHPDDESLEAMLKQQDIMLSLVSLAF